MKITNHENKPLSKIYVKVFSKDKSNVVNFHKDGYTDLRGRFDYLSLNNNDLNNKIDKFSVFVMSDELGSLIKEAKVPPTLAKVKDTV